MAFPQIRASIPSSATDTDSNSFSCTHPTGLTAGDLMILYAGLFNAAADRTLDTPSGWTKIYESNSSNRRALYCFQKIATSGDVSAGSTTVAVTGAINIDKFAYGFFAITGAASGSEITVGETDIIAPTTATLTATTSLTPVVPESLVLSAFLPTDLDLSAILTASSFALTPTTTMTERVDVGVRDGSSDGMSLMVASGEYSGLSGITSREVTVSESITGNSPSIILLVNAPVSATGTNALLEVSPAIFTAAGVEVGGTGTNALLEVEPEVFTQNGKAQNVSQWTNPDKPSSTWTNPAK